MLHSKHHLSTLIARIRSAICIVRTEMLKDMTASTFVNAHRRFIGKDDRVKIFLFERSTNFVGVFNEQKLNVINNEDEIRNQGT